MTPETVSLLSWCEPSGHLVVTVGSIAIALTDIHFMHCIGNSIRFIIRPVDDGSIPVVDGIDRERNGDAIGPLERPAIKDLVRRHERVRTGLGLDLAVWFGDGVLVKNAARDRGVVIHHGLRSLRTRQGNLLSNCHGLVVEYKRLVVRLAKAVVVSGRPLLVNGKAGSEARRLPRKNVQDGREGAARATMACSAFMAWPKELKAIRPSNDNIAPGWKR